jgi:hypothetical protein
MIDQAVDGRVCNLYVFNGAGQTGRGSSRSLQAHNWVRDVMPNELDVLDMVVARVPIDKLRHLPLSKKPVDIERAARGQPRPRPEPPREDAARDHRADAALKAAALARDEVKGFDGDGHHASGIVASLRAGAAVRG